jgi:hypothetical protein
MRKKNIKNKKIKNILSNQKGIALLTTLIFIFILVTFGVALLSMTSNDIKLSALQRDSTKAFYIAEAGIEKALYILKNDYENDQNWDGIDPPLDQGDFDEGAYTVTFDIKSPKSVTIKSKGIYIRPTRDIPRYVQVDATVGNLSIWDNAIFAGSGQSGKVINGNVDIRGSVHILGTEGSTAMEALDITGTAGIGNNYDGMDSDLRNRIPNDIPDTIELNGDMVETLNAKLRVMHGDVNLSGTATIGDPNISGNSYKETLDGVYINGDFGGTAGEDNVFSDNGTEQPYDFGEGIFKFPLLTETYTDYEGNTYTCGGSNCTYLQYYTNYGLNITDTDTDSLNKVSSISSDTESFSIPETDPYSSVNYIIWDKDNCILEVKGIIYANVENINIEIGIKGDQIKYSGTGTIVSQGDISVHGDLLANELFPTTDSLGLIAYNDINLATGPGDSQLKMMGAFYAQNKITSAKQNQIAGTFVSDNFDMGINVPKIFQVPGLENNLPPGMPGATITYTMHTSNWHEVHE